VGVVKSRGGGISIGIPVGVPIGITITPVPVLAAVIVAVAILIPVGVLVLVPVGIVGSAVAYELPNIGLLDDSLSTVLQRKFGNGVCAWAESPWSGWTRVGYHPDHLIRAVGGSFLIEFNSID
jgi:hypothetical protein